MSYLTPKEHAAREGVDERTVRRWIAAGTVRANRVGGRWRIPIETDKSDIPRETASNSETPAVRIPRN